MKYELLLPAGDLERLKFAFIYGADAVYIGGTNYSLRANANNFTIDEIKQACEFAHKLNKKVYVTVNMIFHNDDLKDLDVYLITLDKIGVDSLIISDFAVIESIKRLGLKISFFISTQKSITNLETVKFYESLGAYRVVLARECSRDDIKYIKENTNCEVEVFIHGAMCTSYSGRCVLSNYITKRDSNRGGCAQICRFVFDNKLTDKFTFSSKDLNMIDYISDMMDLGIESYKVEGRMKSMYYIATVCNAYRKVIDAKINGNLTSDMIDYYKKVLNRCSNRENMAQFYNGEYGVDAEYYSGRVEVSNQDFLGLVLDYDKDGYAVIEQRNRFNVNDEVEFFGPNLKPITYTIKDIINSDNISVNTSNHAREIVKIKVPFKLSKYDIMRVKIS